MVSLRHLLLGIAALMPTASLATEGKCESSRYEHKPRLFVLTDMSNEPDDQMSLVRLLTYSNEIDIVGISAITSQWMQDRIDPETIRKVIGGYGEVVDNLDSNVPHEGAYPAADGLIDMVTEGHPVFGLKALDLNMSSAATALIEAADVSSESDPLWVSIWGGASVLAEALQHVSQTRSEDEVAKFVDKLRVYSISDQDDAGPWIRDRYPLLFKVVSLHGYSEYSEPTWIGISGEELRHFDKGGPMTPIVSNEWLEKHIRIGPLGSHYLEWHYIMEGDTPAYLPLVQNGLGDMNNPQWGSWGGRYSLLDTSGNHRTYSDCADWVQGENGEAFMSKFATIWRWREAYQYDFAARMQWTVEGDFSKNNHQPVAIVNGSCGPLALELNVMAGGGEVVLDASDSWDPDSDELSFDWFHYREAGGRGLEGFEIPLVSEAVIITKLNDAGSVVSLAANGTQSQPMHIILTVRDNRDMPLPTYRRIILNWESD